MELPDHSSQQPSPEHVLAAIIAFLSAETWSESEQIVATQQALLLSDTADQIFAALLQQYAHDANATQSLSERWTLLRHARSEGITTAFGKKLQQMSQTAISQQFLRQALQATLESNGNRQVVYPLLEANIDQLTLALAQTLHDWGMATLLQLPAEQAEQIAIAIGNLSNLIQQFPRGSQMANLEIAITGYQIILSTIFSRTAKPVIWATIMMNLGTAYLYRICGDRAENLEQAVHCHQQALEVNTRRALPVDWAQTIMNLGNAYFYRVRGERSENLEQAIHCHQQALEVRTRDAMPIAWSNSMQNLGLAYRYRIRGERAENLEQAIDCFQQALEVRTRTALSEAWAETMHNLGSAYVDRVRGDRADNLERAIHCYQQALEVRTCATLPNDWAKTMTNLGIAYAARIRGERADNLEHAIDCYQQALEIITRSAAPVDWSTIMLSLGDAYLDRIQGERAENLEQALECYQQVLTITVRTTLPIAWAEAMASQGSAYTERIRGERAENLEHAITCFRQALEVRTRAALPEAWAATLHNLGSAYLYRIRGERAENIEQAIACFQQALEVRTQAALPVEWATTMLNQGNAYLFRVQGERAENLEYAIDCYQQALEVMTRSSMPVAWAQVMLNLGSSYVDRILGDPAANRAQAIACYQQALEVRTRRAMPVAWATTMNNLGNAYRLNTQQQPAAQREEAIFCYQQALEIRTPEALPHECRDTASNLGLTLYELGRYGEAQAAWASAHAAIQNLRSEAPRQAAKRRLADDNANLYAHLVACCLREGDVVAAFQYTVAAKGRAFADTLASTRFDLRAATLNNPELAQDVQRARELRQAIDSIHAQLSSQGRITTADPGMQQQQRGLFDTLRRLQQQETKLWDDLSYRYPALTATQQAPTLTVADAQQLAHELDATLVEYYLHAEGWCAFVVTAEGVQHVPLALLTEDFLYQSMAPWLDTIENPNYRVPLTMYGPLYKCYKPLIAPLREHLPAGGKVIVAPHSLLNLFPLGATRDPQTKRYLCEDYLLAFAPSLSALWVMRQQAISRQEVRQVQNGLRLFSAAYAPDMPDLVPATQHIVQVFAPYLVEQYDHRATPDTVIAATRQAPAPTILHIAAHGWFDLDLPEQSGLALYDGWLTVQRILSEMPLQQTQLVTLASCLLGRTRPELSGETVGVTQAFLTAGAQAVVTALWSVELRSTMALFQTFYQCIIAGEAPAQALQTAMAAIRATPSWEHPYYWAAWQVYGLAL